MNRRNGKTTRRAMRAVDKFLGTGIVYLRDTKEVPMRKEPQRHILYLFEKVLSAVNPNKILYSLEWMDDKKGGWKITRGYGNPNCDPSNHFVQVPKGQSIIREAAKKAVDKFFQDNPDLVPGHIFEKGERWDNTSTTFQGGTEVTIGGVNKDSLIALRDHINEVLSQMP